MGPVWHGGKAGAGLLRNAYETSFTLAKKSGLKTIAFPAISIGVYGYPIEEAARIALGAGMKREKDFDEIRYICFSAADHEVYKCIWQELSS